MNDDQITTTTTTTTPAVRDEDVIEEVKAHDPTANRSTTPPGPPPISTNTPTATATVTTASCCGDFIETLNKPAHTITLSVKFEAIGKTKATATKLIGKTIAETTEKKSDEAGSPTLPANENSDEDTSLHKKFVINSNFSEADVLAYLNYCNTWPQR